MKSHWQLGKDETAYMPPADSFGFLVLLRDIICERVKESADFSYGRSVVTLVLSNNRKIRP